MTIKRIFLLAIFFVLTGLILPCMGQEDSLSQKNTIVQKMLDELSSDTATPSAPGLKPKEVSPANPVYPLSQDLSLSKYIPENQKNDEPPIENSQSKEDISDDQVIDVLELKDVDIGDVLKLLSQKSNLNIIANQNVRGKVTIFLKDVKLKDALTIILDSNNLAYKFEDGIIRVMPTKEYEDRYGLKFGGNSKTLAFHLNYANVNDVTPVLMQIKNQSGKILADTKSNTLVLIDTSEKLKVMENLLQKIDVPVQTEIFELVYAQAKTVFEKLSEVISKDSGHLRFDERSNKIVVTDTPTKIKEISTLIKAFDTKEPQVLIEAKIIQVTLDKQTQFGINWERLLERYHGLDFKSDFQNPTSTLSSSLGTLSIGSLGSDQYTVVIKALQAMQHTTILSSPSIITLSNHEAKILVGTTQPYITSTTTTPSSGPSTTAESVNFIDIGVKLYVTPIIHQDRFITMKIRPEVSSAPTSLSTSSNNKIPIVDTSQAETNVVVKDGVTILIGGLIKDQMAKASSRVPFLGNIPLLGAAFRSSDVHPTKSEIVIFLTPKIISGDVPMALKTENFNPADLKEASLDKNFFK